MKVQKFEGLPITNQVFKSHSNRTQSYNNKKFFDMDSVDGALSTDSIEDPILPQIVRKFKRAFNIIFPEKIIEEAKSIKSDINQYVDGQKFQAVA